MRKSIENTQVLYGEICTLPKPNSFGRRMQKDLKRNRALYLLIIPVVAYYFIFCYVPMYGVIMAFQDYEIGLGVIGSEFVGFKHFAAFFNGAYFGRLMKNTLTISFASLIFGFPMPVILALMLNEVRKNWFKRTVQTITYMPHFISLVVMVGIMKEFTSVDGIIGAVYARITGSELSMMSNPSCFVPLYVASNIWQGAGWDSIIYLAALAGIDMELYDACKIDGGGHMRQLMTVTLPGILPTIVTLLILRIGGILNVGYEKIILMYNSLNMETADVISSYVYRKGLQELDWSYGTAVGLFNSVINILFLVFANYISRKTVETSLW